MRILGIETSCDETAATVVEKKNGRFRLLGSAMASSEEIHQKYGGIIPEKAAREQLKAILPVVEETLAKIHPRGVSPPKTGPFRPGGEFDAIAVTQGPGLIGSLIVGVEVAKTLSFVLNKPIIPINHLLAHLYVNFLDKKSCHSGTTPQNAGEVIKSPPDEILSLESDSGSRMTKKQLFPSIGLIASGGHTDLLLFRNKEKDPSTSSGSVRLTKNFAPGVTPGLNFPNLTDYKWLGGTRDDAAGECFDKCARLLGLGYPGGPEIEAAVSKSKEQRAKSKITKQNLKLPRPMLKEKNFDFSFSGLKTAVLRMVAKSMKQLNNETPKYSCLKKGVPPLLSGASISGQAMEQCLAYEIQEAITDVLQSRTAKAIEKYKVRSVLCGGGVIANSLLRKKLRATCHELRANLFLPKKDLCTDNAAGIAIAGFFGKEVPWKNLRPDPGLEF